MNGWILRPTLATMMLVTLAPITNATEPPGWSPDRYDDGRPRDEAAEIASKRITWPAPVRQVDYQVDYIDESVSVIDSEIGGDVFAVPYGPGPTPQHQILVAPSQTRKPDPHHLGGHGGGLTNSNRPPNRPLHPNYRLHHQVQSPPATIPNAARREIWKTPYSYGHFGASHTRSWSKHNGYRDNITEWRLK